MGESRERHHLEPGLEHRIRDLSWESGLRWWSWLRCGAARTLESKARPWPAATGGELA
jgi:hypothetical protein